MSSQRPLDRLAKVYPEIKHLKEGAKIMYDDSGGGGNKKQVAIVVKTIDTDWESAYYGTLEVRDIEKPEGVTHAVSHHLVSVLSGGGMSSAKKRKRRSSKKRRLSKKRRSSKKRRQSKKRRRTKRR